MTQRRLRPTGKTGLAADLLGGPRLAGTMEHSMRWAQIGGSRYLLTIVYHLFRFLDTVYFSIRSTLYAVYTIHIIQNILRHNLHDENQNLPDFLTGYSESLPPDWSQSAGAPHLTF